VAHVPQSTDQRLRLLQDAARLLGHQELAKRLNVPQSLVDDWIRGVGTISDSGLLKLSEILQDWAKGPKRN
jgi:transcriptional regulator with XRE-family HTH domain